MNRELRAKLAEAKALIGKKVKALAQGTHEFDFWVTKALLSPGDRVTLKIWYRLPYDHGNWHESAVSFDAYNFEEVANGP